MRSFFVSHVATKLFFSCEPLVKYGGFQTFVAPYMYEYMWLFR
jgi:hypothetical protein